MPFPFIAAVAAAVTLKTVIAGTVVVGAAYAGKKIYDASQDGSSSSSSTSGPSAEELREEQRQNVFKQAKENFIQFCITQEDILCVEHHNLRACQEITSDVNVGKLSFEKAEIKRSEFIIDKKVALKGYDGWQNIEDTIANPPKSISDLVVILDNEQQNRMFQSNKYRIILNQNYGLLFSEAKIDKLVPLCEKAITSVAISKELSRVAKFDQKLFRRCDTAQTLVEAARDNPRVVACGLLKAGKSSLLNNLVGSLDDSVFAVDVVRATKKNQEVTHKGICYVDTPGLEANKEDTEEAQKAYITADMLLFIHHGESELAQQEIQWLNNLQNLRADLAQRALLVLTNSDCAGDNLDRLKEKIDEQVRHALGFALPIHVVDNMAYKKSFMAGKEILRQSAGIDQLHMTIEHLRTSLLANFSAEQKEKIHQALVNIQEWIQDYTNKTIAMRKKQEKAHSKLMRDFRTSVVKPAQAALNSIEG